MARSKEKTRTQKKPRSMRRRLMTAIVFILLLTVLIPVIAYYSLPEWVYLFVPGTRLWIASDTITENYGTPEFNEAVSFVEKKYNSTVEIFNADGVFIYSTRSLIDALPQNLSQAEPLNEAYMTKYEVLYGSIKNSQKGFLIKKYTDDNVEVKFLDCYQFLPGGERAEVSVQVTSEGVTARVDFILSFVALMSILIVALIVISVYLKRFTRPVDNMCEITDAIAKLDFSRTCPPTGLAELNRLSESVNSLSTSLSASLADLKEKNKKLEEDIENERTIDNLRQTFISGISHEMKTPIAIIQGYAEGAKMFYEAGNAETAEQYCDIIVRESQRMNTMIMKLLEITKYSSGAYELETTEFNIKELADDWFERNSSILSEKGISVENLIPDDMKGSGDRVILESVVNNYMSNAVSHCDGEKKISAYAEDAGEFYRVYVFNTGEHIADNDIDKIWTSFYRADKSLSRSQGRFGLGLAIVVSIQNLHKAAYGVENVENGVRFYFDIRKAAGKAEKETETN